MVSNTHIQTANAVNKLLTKMLPGAQQMSLGSRKNNNKKDSKAQLIDKNLKQRIVLQERDSLRIKKKQRRQQKNALKGRKLAMQKLDQAAKLRILQKHKEENKLTEREQEYLDILLKKRVKDAQSWSMNEENNHELLEVQEFILNESSKNRNSIRTSNRRKKVKEFKEKISESKSAVADHRYPGLTPGLAPVGLSDEEESSSEEEQEDY